MFPPTRMQTLYCFLYSLISIQWRSYIMYTGNPVLLQLDVVRIDISRYKG